MSFIPLSIFKSSRGAMLMFSLVFAGATIAAISGLFGWYGVVLKGSRNLLHREQAFQVAEAGIDYYRWHLAHDQTDYQDGTGGPGPYVHDFLNKDGVKIGEFSLEIIPPPAGSTVVTIRSTGTILADPSIERAIEVRLAKPSIAKYAFVTNSNVMYGTGDEVFGPIHANGGVSFTGTALAHNIVTSARADYDDPDHGGQNEFGVHVHSAPTDPLPPNPVPTRTDVFEAGRQFPVPTVDFVGLTTDLAQMRTDAQADGFYRTGSGVQGYLLQLKTDDTFDLYAVNQLRAPPNGCVNVFNQAGWGSWSINVGAPATTLLGNFPFPNNGIIFLEDHIWVEGQINGARLTIASGRFPDNVNTRTNIIVNNDLLYTNYDGTDVIGLIAQKNFHIGLYSEDDLRIDAAVVAQNGGAYRFYYRTPGGGNPRCSPWHIRTILTTYGMTGSNAQAYFAYSGNPITGYLTQLALYDPNLLYGPPPSFPLTSDQYEIISWQEI